VAAEDVTAAERRAMERALALAATSGVPTGPNPRVGCVLLDADGEVVAEGFHRGAGTPHAEADALARAGDRARGATAVVTLEPCDHTGRTGPCSRALLDAGVRRVVLAQRDPNPVAAGGAARLRAAGVEVAEGLLVDEARALNREWTLAVERGRPFVTWKYAASLDGRSAAADGTSRWISSAASRRDVHRLRGRVDAVVVGTGTALADDPALTVRDDDGHDLPGPQQPLRVVVGHRDVPPTARVLADLPGARPALHLRTHDPAEVLADLRARDVQHVLLEGGPTLAAAFWRAGLVDEVVAYVAPVLLGAGPAAVGDLGTTTLADAARPRVVDATVVDDPVDGPNVRLVLEPTRPATPDQPATHPRSS